MNKVNQSRLLVIAVSILLSANARAAIYWASAAGQPSDQGVRSKAVSVCFVGDALTARPDRVRQVRAYLRWFEFSANIRFNDLGTCAGPTRQRNGNDFYNGDIRVVIPGTSVNGTGLVPGSGCPMFRNANGQYDGGNEGWGSWSNAPWELTLNRSCLYNLKLGDDPWPTPGGPAVGNPPSPVPYLNHTLHEFGHALGLWHEHDRNDVERNAAGNKICSEAGYGGSSTGLMTPYDRRSVMHYQFPSCGINGNYDNTGLSDWDRLALHILYPEDNHVAEYVGTTVVRTTDMVRLRSAWKMLGANINIVAKDFKWRINNKRVSNTPDLKVNLTEPGKYTFQYSYRGTLGRPVSYTYKGKITVLTPETYDQRMASFVAAQLPLW